MKRTAIIVMLALVLCVAFSGARAQKAIDVVDGMIEAHGGMEAWASAPSVAFTESWTSNGFPPTPESHVVVEQGRRRAYHEIPAMNARIGWDGEQCWSLNWSRPTPPRFIVNLTWYFVNLPWVVKDPGVVLHEPETMTLWNDDTEYISIRMTFDPGTGDTPDDYYVLIIDPETYQLHGCVYVVTYPSLLPEGVTSTPEHVLIFEGMQTVDGLQVPASFTIYEDEKFYAGCKLTGWSFRQPFDEKMVEMPEGAVIDRSMEGGS